MIIKEQQIEIYELKCVIAEMKMTVDGLKDTVQFLTQEIKNNKTESLS